MNLRRIAAAAVALAFAVLTFAGPALAGAAAKATPTAKVNINTASVDQLTTLPGVGPKLAARIVEYRQKSGSFRSTKELMNVSGIGEKNFAKIESWLVVGEPAKAPAK
jgi:competence protein ComEA